MRVRAYREYMLSRDVSLSVCLSHAGIVSKQLNISSKYRDFRSIYHFMSEMIENRATVASWNS